MAEDFACPKFNSYHSAAEELDDRSLYIKNIPASLSEEAFIALMSENGRKVIRSKFFPPRPNSDVTVGVVAFSLAENAAEVMQQMNRKPPLNMDIEYARKNKKSATRGDFQRDSSSSGSHSRRPPHLSTFDAPPLPAGRGRGSLISSVSNSPIDLQNDSRRPTLLPTPHKVPSLGRGNLLSNAIKFPPLRVVLDGQKRSSFTPCSSEIISSPPSDIPELVENPFLKCSCCDNVGKFSCATCKRPYCSSSCQVEDWPKHKILCSSNKRSRDSSYVSESSGSDSEKKSPKSAQKVALSKQQPVTQVVKIKDILTEALPKDKHIKVKVSHIMNPSKFWVQPSTAQDRLAQMERDLALFAKQTPPCCDLSHVYCVHHRGSCKRVAVLEVNGDKKALVQFLDYGNTDTVQTNQLFLLPKTFKEIPYQAIQCKLGDTGEEKDVAWSEDDTAIFRLQSADNQSYKARALKHLGNDTYEVNLSDDEGISLYSIISELRNPNLSSVEVKEIDSAAAGSKQPPIPSVCSYLKNGDVVRIVGVEFSEDQFWGVLDNGTDVTKHIEELDCIFQSLDTKDYSLCAEEGDVVAGFSLSFKQFYRCVVLKRMRERFLVHYIDYGNKEEISKLCELTPELRSKCCYVVCCPKPDSLSHTEFKSLFSEFVSVCVNKSGENSTKLSFLHKNCKTFLNCFPWYHGILQVKPTELSSQSKHGSVTTEQEAKISKRPPMHVGVAGTAPAISKQSFSEERGSKNSQSRPLLAEHEAKKRITSDLVPDMPFVSSTKYRVKVVFIGGGSSKIFIQLHENESKLEILMKQLNKHCSLNKSDIYNPIKNEIVCCKYKEDCNWYRGQVIGKKGKTYRVFFVDFGNEDWVTEEEMRPLPTNLSSHRFVLCTSLHNVSDEDLKELIPKLTSEYWDMKVIDKSSLPVQIMLYQGEKPLTDFLKKKFVPVKASLSRQKLPEGRKCEVMVSHSEKGVVYVQQMEDAQQIQDLVNKMNSAVATMSSAKEILIDHVYCALFTDGLWYRASIDQDLQSNQYLATFVDFGNQETVDLKNLKELSEEFFKFPIFSISVVPQNGNLSQMQTQVKYHVQVMGEKSGAQLVKILNAGKSDGFQTAEVNDINISSLEKQLIPSDKTVEVSVCHVEEDIYYCQRVCDQVSIKSLESKLLSAAAYQSLNKLPNVGCVVCAKFSDKVWYRGSVEEICESLNSCKICFIDYGNTETISVENMRILPAEMNSFPIFSIPVKFSNLEELQKLAENGAVSFRVKALKLLAEGIQLVKVAESEDKKPIHSYIKLSSLEKQLIPSNKTVEISVCFVEEDIYYCQLVCNQDRIKSLESKLLSAAAYQPLKELPDVGCVVCAKFSDNVWYRGSVQEICQSLNSCKICFIDYGNTETISVENMRILPAEMSLFPIFSIPIKFSNLEELQKLAENGAVSFNVQALELLAEGIQLVKVAESENKKPIHSYTKVSSLKKQLIPSDKTVEVSVCHVEEDIYYCQLVCEQDRLKSLETRLLSAAAYESLKELPDVGCVVCAKFSDNVWYRGSVEESQSLNSCKICFIDYGNTETISVENMRILSAEMNSFPIFSIPVKFSNLEELRKLVENGAVSFHVQALKLLAEGIQLVKVAESKDKKPIFTSIAAQLLSDLPIEVVVCHEEGGLYYVQKVSDLDSLNEMMMLLQSPENLDAVKHTPKVGEIVCAKSSDGLWYRGMVNNDCGNGILKVFFVDFGSTENVSKEHVCYLLPACASLPMFSIPIKLSDLNKYTKCLTVASKYTVKRIGTAPDNVQIVKVRPSVKSISFGSIQSSRLENDLTLVNFHNSCEEYHFLTKCSDIDRLNEMNKLLEEFKGEEIFDIPAVDEVLIVKGADRNWSRAYIQVTNVRPGFCRVLFVDKGISEEVPYSDVCYMPELFISFPLFNIKVLVNSQVEVGKDCVVQVESRTGDVPLVRVVAQYTLGSLEKLYLPLQTPKKVKFCYGDRDVFFVQVVDQIPLFKELSQEVQMCSLGPIVHIPRVGELLVAQSNLDNVRYRCCVEEVVSCDMFKVNFIDYGKSEVLSKEKLYYFRDNFLKYPLFYIGIKISNSSAPIALGQEYTVLAKNLPESGEHQVVELICEAVLPQNQPLCKEMNESNDSVGKYFFDDLKFVPFPSGEQDLIIYSVASPDHVFCAPFNMQNLNDSTKLLEKINIYCKELTNVSSYEGEPPRKDEMVLAKFNGEWFRAAVLDATDAPNYEVLYVDYGNTEVLTPSLMRRMTSEFMSLEVQAHFCPLQGYQFREADSTRIVKEIEENFTMIPVKGIATKVEDETQIQIVLITEHLRERNLITS